MRRQTTVKARGLAHTIGALSAPIGFVVGGPLGAGIAYLIGGGIAHQIAKANTHDSLEMQEADDRTADAWLHNRHRGETVLTICTRLNDSPGTICRTFWVD